MDLVFGWRWLSLRDLDRALGDGLGDVGKDEGVVVEAWKGGGQGFEVLSVWVIEKGFNIAHMVGHACEKLHIIGALVEEGLGLSVELTH